MAGGDLSAVYNHIEPFIWYGVALLLLPALHHHASWKERIILSFVICIFGTSDFYESVAWWTPWWLFAWKAGALTALMGMGLRIWRREKAVRSTTLSSPERLR